MGDRSVQSMNVALIGAGRIGRLHARTINADAGSRLAAIADADPQAARTLGEEMGVETRDVEAVLADEGIQAILIASSTNTHADLIERGTAAGKAVFCEKPVDLALARAEACAIRVEATGEPVMIGFNRRFDPNFQALREAYVNGEIGQGEMLMITSFDPAPPPLTYITASGGQFRDQMIHDFDIANWLWGMPKAVTAAGSCLVDPAIGEAGDTDTAIVTLHYADGRLATIRNTRRASYGHDQRIELLGATGLLDVGNVTESTLIQRSAEGSRHSNPVHFFLERYMTAFDREWRAFREALLSGSPMPVTVRDGVNALLLAEAAMRSLAEQKTVAIAAITGQETG